MANRKKYYLWLGIGVMTLLLTVGVCAYPIYIFWQSEWKGPYQNTTSVADLDGDSDLDALVGTSLGAEVWLNQGSAQGGQVGVFAQSGQEIAGNPTETVFLADFDGDGDPDALVAGVKRAVIWKNDGQGNFTRTRQRFGYSECHGLAVDDFNADGFADIFAGAYATFYRVWLSKGDGTFRPRNLR